MDQLLAMEAQRGAHGAKFGRPVGVHVLAWVGGIVDPAQGPLQAISGGTWSARPIGKRLTLDVGLGGTRYLTSFTFEPGYPGIRPIAVSIYTRHDGAWKFVRRCQLQPSTTRCFVPPLQAQAVRLEFDPGTACKGSALAIGPVAIDLKRIQ